MLFRFYIIFILSNIIFLSWYVRNRFITVFGNSLSFSCFPFLLLEIIPFVILKVGYLHMDIYLCLSSASLVVLLFSQIHTFRKY